MERYLDTTGAPMRIVTLAILLTLSITNPLLADSGWGQHTENGEWAFANGDYERAETEFRRAFDIAKTLPENDVRLEESLRNLARLYEHMSEPDRAEPLYLLLLAAQEHRLGTRSPELLETLAALARVAIPVGDHPIALESLETYVAIADDTGLADEDSLRIVLEMLARMYLLEDRGDEALTAQRRATAMVVDNPGLDAEERTASLESLAQLELRFGEPEAAGQALDRLVAIRREHDPESNSAEIFTSAAQTAFGFGEFATATRLAQRALAEATTEEAVLAATQVQADAAWMLVRRSSESMTDLAGVARDDTALATAAETLATLDQKQSAAMPDEHPDHLETLERLTMVNVMGGNLIGAIAFQRRIVEINQATSGPASEATRKALRGLVDLNLLDPTRVGGAADANSALLESQEAAWGPDDSRLLPTLQRQYDLLLNLKEKKAAKKVKKRMGKLEKMLR